jgi:ectoine hydroxylase-related dioxygenase (phytanoyl-CoA dioxygenase family)
MLWIDADDAPERIAKIRSPTLRQIVGELREDGFTVLKGAADERDCDALRKDFAEFREAHPEETKKATLKEGFTSRLYNIHRISAAGMRVALNPLVMNVLDQIFSERAALNTTLFFEQGSQQPVHRDTPFFTAARYPGEYVGAWYALEDVDEDAGPLVYFPGAHKIPVNLEQAKACGAGEPLRVGEMFEHYCRQVTDGISAGGYKEHKLILKKGDVAIWHPELPHGGSAINTPGKTRRSLVAHYIPEGAYIQTVGYFFKLEEPRQIMEFIDAAQGRMMRWVEPPQFMPNN